MAKGKLSQLLEKLDNDCIEVLLEHIYLTDRKTLVQLSRSSRALYKLATPWLYRNMNFNLSNQAHLRLLHRLLKEGSSLPSFIRILRIYTNTDTGDLTETLEERLASVMALIKRLKSLTRITWIGHISFPDEVLDIIRKFPKAAFEIPGVETWWTVKWPNCRGSNWNFLRHPAASQLTIFHFCPSMKSQLYPRFKRDLVQMLSRNTALKDFAISPTFVSYLDFPVMTSTFAKSNLPQLMSFTLQTMNNVFTPEELTIWGEKGGWDELKTLRVSTIHILAFIGRTPKLEKMGLQIEPEWHMHELEDHFASLPSLPSMPEMHYLEVFDSWRVCHSADYPHGYSILSPSLIRMMPGLETLRARSLYGNAGNVPSLTAAELSELRESCKNVDQLMIDICVTDGAWPFDVLDEIAHFEKLDNLFLLFHTASADDTRAFLTKRNTAIAFKYIMTVRRSAKLPIERGWSAEIRPQRFAGELENSWFVPSYTIVWTPLGFAWSSTSNLFNDKGKQDEEEKKARKAAKRAKLPKWSTMTDAEVERMRENLQNGTVNSFFAQFTQHKLYREEKRLLSLYLKEEAKRKRKNELVQKFGENATLLDVWREDNREEGHAAFGAERYEEKVEEVTEELCEETMEALGQVRTLVHKRR
ncbi:hypothetical protein CC80DRAFT_530403 [Byssothecium circinans]|uniref:Uncharacterized protein n=1 Tax=Byssothecium circinans TaxID=147558 RepID=A0A6A5UED1_9PLEO|nr:hypothetical protein CC80DRAFT_530403 [Byssothecium circinans]